jgi:hypothetical protein
MRSEQFRGQDCAQAGKALYQRDKAHDMKRRRGIVEKRKKLGARQSQRQTDLSSKLTGSLRGAEV